LNGVYDFSQLFELNNKSMLALKKPGALVETHAAPITKEVVDSAMAPLRKNRFFGHILDKDGGFHVQYRHPNGSTADFYQPLEYVLCLSRRKAICARSGFFSSNLTTGVRLDVNDPWKMYYMTCSAEGKNDWSSDTYDLVPIIERDLERSSMVPIPTQRFESPKLAEDGCFEVQHHTPTLTITTFKTDLNGILGVSSRKAIANQTGFFSSKLATDIQLDANEPWKMKYKASSAEGANDCSGDTYDLVPLFEVNRVNMFALKNAFFSCKYNYDKLQRETLASETVSPRNSQFKSHEIDSEGIFRVTFSQSNRPTIYLKARLDDYLGVSGRKAHHGQTGFFSSKLTKEIQLCLKDGWKIHYKACSAQGKDDWVSDTYDLFQIIDLSDNKIAFKQPSIVTETSSDATTKPAQGSTEKAEETATEVPPKYQHNVDADNAKLGKAKKELSDIKTEVEQLRAQLRAAKEDLLLNDKRHEFKIDEVKSKLRTARSTARTEIKMLKRAIKRLEGESDTADEDDEDKASDDDNSD